MRTPQQMMGLITGFAEEDPRVLAAFINGSRANPATAPDTLQDFDVVYVVKNTAPFIQNQNWLAHFGKVALIQQPDDKTLFADGCCNKNRYAFLMQFADGNRIDLSLQSVAYTLQTYYNDLPVLPLVDKNNLLPAPTPQQAPQHLVKKPTQAQFTACCNQFWWVSTYVAKGLWRGELLYALAHLEEFVRPMLLRLLSWQVGAAANFSISTGKCHKHLQQLLPKNSWRQLLKTYPHANVAEIWDALDAACALFSSAAKPLAASLGLQYNTAEQTGAKHHIAMVRKLPRASGASS